MQLSGIVKIKKLFCRICENYQNNVSFFCPVFFCRHNACFRSSMGPIQWFCVSSRPIWHKEKVFMSRSRSSYVRCQYGGKPFYLLCFFFKVYMLKSLCKSMLIPKYWSKDRSNSSNKCKDQTRRKSVPC